MNIFWQNTILGENKNIFIREQDSKIRAEPGDKGKTRIYLSGN